MVEWANIRPNDSLLEPSAGHGAIARWFPDRHSRTVIEPSMELGSRLGLITDANLVNERFEDWHIINKRDVIVMNPPFGVGGKTAIEHLDLAYQHLHDGGRIVAIIPEGPLADKRFDQWLYEEGVEEDKREHKDAYLAGQIHLPTVTFERAGTQVKARVVIIDKVSNPQDAPQEDVRLDLSDAKTINELFDRIEGVDGPARPEVTVKEQPKPGRVITQLAREGTQNNYEVRFPYNDQLVKQIPGRRWNGVQRVWLVPTEQREKLLEFAKKHQFNLGPLAEETPPPPLTNQRGSVATDILTAPARAIGQAARKYTGNRRVELEALLGEGKGHAAYDDMQWAAYRAETQIANVIETTGELLTHEGLWKVLSRTLGPRAAAEVSRFFRSSKWLGQMFGVPAARQDALFNAAEGIKTFNGQNPEFGTRVFEKDPDTNELIRDASGNPIMKEWRYTPAQAEAFWKALNDREKAAVKYWVEMRDVVKAVFNVSGEIEGYMHHFWDRGFFEGLGAIMGRRVRLKKKKAGARIGRQAEEGKGFIRDFERSIIKVQSDLIKEDEWNKMVTRLVPLVTKPIGPEGALPGWQKIEKLALTRRAKFIGQMGGGRQIPTQLYDEMIAYGDRVRDASAPASGARVLGSYMTANLLLHFGTFANNIIGSGIQYQTLVLDTAVKAMLTGQVRPFVDTVTAPLRALLPSNIQRFSPEMLGSHSNLISQFESRGPVDAAFSAILGGTMGAVDNYVKRSVAIAVSKSLGLPTVLTETRAHKQAYSDMRKLVDTFGLDYANINSRLAKFRSSPYSRWASPFVTYGYKIMQMQGHYLAALNPGAKMDVDPRFQFDRSLLAKTGLSPEHLERISRLIVLGAIYSLLASLFPDDEEKTGPYKPGMPRSLDRTGMLKVRDTAAGREQWWRPGGHPWFPLFMTLRAAHRAYQHGDSPTRDILEGIGTYSPSAGPALSAIAAAYDYQKDPDRYPLGPSLARAVKPFIPLGRIAEGVRRMQGGPEVQSRTFTQELAETSLLPISDEWIGARKIVMDPLTQEPVLRDPTVEQMRFWAGIFLRDIDSRQYTAVRGDMVDRAIDRLDTAETLDQFNNAVDDLKTLDRPYFERLSKQITQQRIQMNNWELRMIQSITQQQQAARAEAEKVPVTVAPQGTSPAQIPAQ
jgi:hypothetical protein